MRFFEHLQQGTFQMTGAKLKKSADATAINLLAAREFPFPLDKAKFSPSEFKDCETLAVLNPNPRRNETGQKE
eukprot:4711546-Amphidinium_carterae.1